MCHVRSTMGKVVPAAIFIVTAFQLLADGTSSLWPSSRSMIRQVRRLTRLLHLCLPERWCVGAAPRRTLPELDHGSGMFDGAQQMSDAIMSRLP